MVLSRRILLSGLLAAAFLPHPRKGWARGAAAQTRLDARALTIFRSSDVREATTRLENFLRADTVAARLPDRLAHAASEIAFGQVQSVINPDVVRPVLYENTAPEHLRAGMVIPSGKFALSNPDTLFRSSTIDPKGHYLLEGQFAPTDPAYLSIHLYARDGGEVISTRGASVLFDRDLKIDRRGSFSVAIGPEDWAGTAMNRLVTTPSSANLNLVVRDTIADWARERAARLSIRRADAAPAAPDVSDADFIARAVEAIERAGPGIIKFRQTNCFATPANTLAPPRAHLSGRWALITTGNFALPPGHALLVTLDSLGARYLGFQTADLATGTLQPERRTSSLNDLQTIANADGSTTFVLSPVDPGCQNWVDTDGQAVGLMMARWQGLPQDIGDAFRSPELRVVSLDDLGRALEASPIRPVSPAERARERADRARHFASRFARL